jgi:hypothetical protein
LLPFVSSCFSSSLSYFPLTFFFSHVQMEEERRRVAWDEYNRQEQLKQEQARLAAGTMAFLTFLLVFILFLLSRIC